MGHGRKDGTVGGATAVVTAAFLRRRLLHGKLAATRRRLACTASEFTDFHRPQTRPGCRRTALRRRWSEASDLCATSADGVGDVLGMLGRVTRFTGGLGIGFDCRACGFRCSAGDSSASDRRPRPRLYLGRRRSSLGRGVRLRRRSIRCGSAESVVGCARRRRSPGRRVPVDATGRRVAVDGSPVDALLSTNYRRRGVRPTPAGPVAGGHGDPDAQRDRQTPTRPTYVGCPHTFALQPGRSGCEAFAKLRSVDTLGAQRRQAGRSQAGGRSSQSQSRSPASRR